MFLTSILQACKATHSPPSSTLSSNSQATLPSRSTTSTSTELLTSLRQRVSLHSGWQPKTASSAAITRWICPTSCLLARPTTAAGSPTPAASNAQAPEPSKGSVLLQCPVPTTGTGHSSLSLFAISACDLNIWFFVPRTTNTCRLIIC